MGLWIRCELIDLHFGGAPQRDRRLPRRHRRRPGALRLRADVDARPRSKPGSPRTASSSRDVRHLLLSHIHLDHAGAAGSLVRRQPGADRLGVARSARRTSSTRRGSSARRGGSTATCSTRSGASSRRCPRRTSASPTATSSAGRRSRRRGTRRTTSATSATGRCSPAMRPACACPARATCCRSRRRPTSTSRAGTRPIAAIRRATPERLALIHFGVHEDVDAHLDRLDARARPLGGARRATA